MNILILGSGGREHALTWKIKQSPHAEKIFCAPGNPGIAEIAQCVTLADHTAIVAFCRAENIGLVMVGPEQPLVDGVADALRAANIPVFGPSAAAAQLEGSKNFTKELCTKYNIPTAAYATFTDAAAAKSYIEKQGAPIVVKADGLAAGKGVTVAMKLAEALQAVDECFDGRFGAAGTSVVIEEFMEGEEASFFALCDGRTALELGSAQDHKRAFDGDTGPNTGGMGTYTPPPVVTPDIRARVMAEIIHPSLRGMAADGHPFQGILFAGLMITKTGPRLIEYNVRFGDPETQSLMLLLESDIVPYLLACANGTLAALPAPKFHAGAALCVVMAARGYPGDYEKGSVIRGLENFNVTSHDISRPHPGPLPEGEGAVQIFHAGTSLKDGNIIATGGRVLGVTARGETIAAARAAAYAAIQKIDWPEGFYRTDIAWRGVT